MSVWDGVVVSALEKAYEKPPERPPQDDDTDNMDADDDPMETTDNWARRRHWQAGGTALLGSPSLSSLTSGARLGGQ